MPMLRLCALTCLMGRPFSQISPLVGLSKPANIFRQVVLPDPEGPSRVTNSPRAMSMLKSATENDLPS